MEREGSKSRSNSKSGQKSPSRSSQQDEQRNRTIIKECTVEYIPVDKVGEYPISERPDDGYLSLNTCRRIIIVLSSLKCTVSVAGIIYQFIMVLQAPDSDDEDKRMEKVGLSVSILKEIVDFCIFAASIYGVVKDKWKFLVPAISYVLFSFIFGFVQGVAMIVYGDFLIYFGVVTLVICSLYFLHYYALMRVFKKLSGIDSLKWPPPGEQKIPVVVCQ